MSGTTAPRWRGCKRVSKIPIASNFSRPLALVGFGPHREKTMTYGTLTDHYPATSKLLHWLIAACVLTTAPVAIAMTRLEKGPTQDTLYNFHKSLGVLILT